MVAARASAEAFDDLKAHFDTRVAHEVDELRNKVEIVEKRATERRQLDDKKQKEEISFLKYQGQNLDQFLRSITGAK